MTNPAAPAPKASPASAARTLATESAKRARDLGVTPRSVVLGLLLTVLCDFWIHYAELIMGGAQGHTALAGTSIPFGPFCLVFVLAGINVLCRMVLPGLVLTGAELLVVYVMITTSAVLSSSGQLHFIIPTVTAAWHYANDENGWASVFHRFVPHWMAQTEPRRFRRLLQGQNHAAVGVVDAANGGMDRVYAGPCGRVAVYRVAFAAAMGRPGAAGLSHRCAAACPDGAGHTAVQAAFILDRGGVSRSASPA